MRFFACLLVLCSLGACASDDPTVAAGPDLSGCGFPKVDPKADVDLVPPSYLLGGEAKVGQTEVKDGRLIGALHVPHSVDEAFGLYKKAVSQTRFEVLQEDNEGFEAELYLKSGRELGSLQIRSTKCPDAVIVYMNLPAERTSSRAEKRR